MDFLKKCCTKKESLKFTTAIKPNHLLYFLGVLLLPFAIYIYLVFQIFKKISATLALFYIGSAFKGFQSNADGIWAVEEKEWRSIIVGLMFVKSKEKIEILKRIKKRLKEKVFDRPQDYPKLRSTWHQFLGYIYLLPDMYTLEDCLKPMNIAREYNEFITEVDLKNFLENYGNTGLPKNDTGLFEIIVGEQPVDFLKDKYYTYPIIIRFHHIVGDGSSLLSFLAKVFCDDQLGPDHFDMERLSKNGNTRYLRKSWKCAFRYLNNVAEKISHFIYILYTAVGTLIFMIFLRDKDRNALHGPKLSGKKIVAWMFEDKSELVPMVKKIKNTIPGTTFSDVVYTAISATLYDYFTRKGLDVPEKILTAIPLVISQRNLGNKGPAILENDVTGGLLSLPIKRNGRLLNVLEEVKEQNRLRRIDHHVEVSYWSMNYYLNPWPLQIMKKVAFVEGITTVINNLPAGPKMTFLGGCELTSALAFAPNRWKTGIMLSIISYDNRFQISLFADRVLIAAREEAQNIVDGFERNIRLLNEEVNTEFKYLESKISNSGAMQTP